MDVFIIYYTLYIISGIYTLDQDFDIYHLGEWMHPVELADVVGLLVGALLLRDEHSGLKEAERYMNEHSGLTKGREVHLNSLSSIFFSFKDDIHLGIYAGVLLYLCTNIYTPEHSTTDKRK